MQQTNNEANGVTTNSPQRKLKVRVTPRQKIDVSGMKSFGSSIKLSARTKSCHILMHIETLYLVVFKLEDIDFEKRDELLPELIQGLTAPMVRNIVAVRKGKKLLCRIMPLLRNSEHRWEVWRVIFSILEFVVRYDGEGLMYAMFSDFKSQIKDGGIRGVITIANSILTVDINLFKNKFFISCIVVLIMQAEWMLRTENTTLAAQCSWVEFLKLLVNGANEIILPQGIGAPSQYIAVLEVHFKRFPELRAQKFINYCLSQVYI